jgi:hypothetical protein
MHAILLRPVLHGALGPWDEVLNLLPFALGGALLFFRCYFARLKRGAWALTHKAARPARSDSGPAKAKP